MRKGGIAAVALLLAVFAGFGHAQSSNATLGGTVSDASRALIPGVTVTATNSATALSTTATTNETGAYQFPPLQPGSYRVTAALPGFRTFVYNDVGLGLSQIVRLNFTLEVAPQAQTVEVTVAADTLIATTSSSIGTVIPESKIRDLPLGNRDITDLMSTAAGVVGTNIAGAPTGFVMTTRDGIPVNQGRYNPGVFTQTWVSPDLVEEIRLVISPADAELGRGSAQLQMLTRSGSNDFRGSVFWSNRNSVWDANSFSNNFNGINKNYLNRNQYGGRLGGPIVQNKTFFFFLYEGQRAVEKAVIQPIVLTRTAREGTFRYFPGVQNAGATATVPTVDLNGEPLRPAAATGPLGSFSVFGLDPLRPQPDQSGLIKKIIDAMPLPNNFEAFNGVDGLNTARHKWVRRRFGTDTLSGGSEGDFSNRDQINVRIDHNFSVSHRLSVTATREQSFADLSLSEWPGGFNGRIDQHPRVVTASLVSTLSPTIVNEARFGMRRGRLEALQAFDHPVTGQKAREFMGNVNGIPFTVEGTLFGQSSMVFADNGSIGNATPLFTFADSLGWARGKHAFKGGMEMRRQNGNAWNSDEIVPAVHLGPSPWAGPLGAQPFGPANLAGREYYCFTCGIPVTGVSFPGLNATDADRARALLTDLSGSVANISQGFSLRPDPTNIEWLDYGQYYKKYRDFHQNEFSWFFKDDWKVRPDLTLNLGVRWEWFGVPYEASGMMAAPVGGSDAIFGLSGRSFADWMKPGIRGELTRMEFVGKNSPNPDKLLHENDRNNFAPAVGFSWSLPWFGKDKTVLRAGYNISYGGRFAAGGGLGVDLFVGLAPSTNQFAWHPTTLANEISLQNVAIPVPERNPNGALPVIGVKERNQSLAVYDKNFAVPYIQNFNVELQRQIANNLTFEIRYVASKGTKLEGTLHINNPILVENGLLDAFKTTQTGGNALLFDQIFMGLNVPGAGVVDGINLTGSQALRLFSGTRNFLANNQAREFANYLNTNSSFTGEVGGLLRRANLPENFIVTNPQFGGTTFGVAGAGIVGSINNSTYHSMQMSLTKRLSNGFANQTTYTWSRSIGTNIEDMRNRSGKSLQSFHRTHDIRSNGTFELPFGPNKRLLNNGPLWVSRLVERWQFGGIFNWTSGAPLSFSAGSNPFLTLGNNLNVPDLVGDLPKGSGNVSLCTGQCVTANRPGLITYFDGLSRVADPGASTITDSQTLRTANTQFAIRDSNGRILMTNPSTGTIGTMGRFWIEGPGQYRVDANLIKRITVDERRELEIRMDVINILNHPNFGDPNTDINSPNFGIIALPTTGNRTFTFGARMNF